MKTSFVLKYLSPLNQENSPLTIPFYLKVLCLNFIAFYYGLKSPQWKNFPTNILPPSSRKLLPQKISSEELIPLKNTPWSFSRGKSLPQRKNNLHSSVPVRISFGQFFLASPHVKLSRQRESRTNEKNLL